MPTQPVRQLILAIACLAAICAQVHADELFPPELVRFQEYKHNPVFTGEGDGHWDARIRERGWILREEDGYHLWFTGYDEAAGQPLRLGYATSPDGLQWKRYASNPLDRTHWIEDMMVVKHDGTYYMFAEGFRDRAQLLTSPDRIHWTRVGQLDVRQANGEPISEGPYGTPTAWLEDGTWRLFYERRDEGIWLATSKDLKIWTNVQDEPVLLPGPQAYDEDQVAFNQIVKHNGRYYAYYHGSSFTHDPGKWTTNVAVSDDLIHWTKYPRNPLFPVAQDKSSGILVHHGRQFRLYTMHPEVNVHFPAD